MPRNIFEKSSKENLIFCNEKYLYPEFVPERLPHRDAEIDSLVYCFNPILSGGKPHNVFVSGQTGTGKTVSVKFVLNQLEEHSDRAKHLYLNCFEFNSRHSILSKVVNFLGSAMPRRGVATDEIYSDLLESLGKANFVPVIVFDEADQLFSNEDCSKLLYDLLRVIEYQKSRLCIVLISNDKTLTAKLDARVKSSLAEESIEFSQYSPQQLKDILRERAVYAFLPNVLDGDVINVAAAHAAKQGGDARLAIESLLRAGREAEKENSERVSLIHLKKAFQSIDSFAALKAVKFLSEPEKTILKLISENELISSGDLFRLYSEKSKEKLSGRRLSSLVSNLERSGLISASLLDLGKKGRTRKICLNISKESLLTELKK